MMRAINAVRLASFLCNTRKISMDNGIQTMKEPGCINHIKKHLGRGCQKSKALHDNFIMGYNCIIKRKGSYLKW